MDASLFKMPLYLPAQGASETEATIIEWRVSEGDRFVKGQSLVQVDSAKSVFDFESPCAGKVIRLLHEAGATVPLTEAIMEIETSDARMKDWIPPVAAVGQGEIRPQSAAFASTSAGKEEGVSILGIGGYLPERIVTNGELVRNFPEISADYVYQVTGIHERRWAAADEKPSSMALRAALEAIAKSGIGVKDIEALILATTTPDAAMPSTACILADQLGLPNVPAFDLNAACSGWLYAVAMARGNDRFRHGAERARGGRRYAGAALGAVRPQRALSLRRRGGRGSRRGGRERASHSADYSRRRHARIAFGAARRTRLPGSRRPVEFRPLDPARRPNAVPLCRR